MGILSIQMGHQSNNFITDSFFGASGEDDEPPSGNSIIKKSRRAEPTKESGFFLFLKFIKC